ncbi:hypothetical protein [Actinoplanes derwentensis]|uniref:DUF3592 domain-containing protein n=2 Tax=Actinoplanes derwentensis TaxID=113562 RepID=A0A1H1T5K8_9ACTN|nr:hypothetical protein [Actinoplanes derwentensis]GID88984.1 hypothetical protein Ade03nite_79080 [Actinoplanes derwentensis]SDS55296.1 hypothetical protein SAMN04489716_1038 [Actinoplanes derwentensis]
MILMLFGSAAVDGYRNVRLRLVGTETVAVVSEIRYGPQKDSPPTYRLVFPMEGGTRVARTTRVVGDPKVGDSVPVMVVPDDPDSVAAKEWAVNNLAGVVGRFGAGLLLSLGVFRYLRRKLREEPEPERTIRPRKPRSPSSRTRRRQARRR